MKVFTIAYIRSWNPCYDPKKYLAETWQGTALDILNRAEIPMADKLLVVLRTDLVSERIMRLFAVWCARQYQQTDQRCNTRSCSVRSAPGSSRARHGVRRNMPRRKRSARQR